MNMNGVVKIITIALFAAVLSGCGGIENLPPLDKKTSCAFVNSYIEGDCAVLVIPHDAAIKSIDGKKRGWLFTKWTVGIWAKAWGSKGATLRVPAGKHSIIYEYSNPQEGWKADNLESEVELRAGKMYILWADISEEAKLGTGSSIINIATSFVRDQIIDLLPFLDLLPRQNPVGIIYQINEIRLPIDYTVEMYLRDSNRYTVPMPKILLAVLVGLLWLFVVRFVLPNLCYFIFMGKFQNSHTGTAVILQLSLVAAGVLIINYNISGALFLYILSSVLLGIGISGWGLGNEAAEKAAEKLQEVGVLSANGATEERQSKEIEVAIRYYGDAIGAAPYNARYLNDRGIAYSRLNRHEEAIGDYTKAIELKPQAVYFYNRGVSYSALEDWSNAANDLLTATRLKPNNEQFKKDLAIVMSHIENSGAAASPA